MGMPRRRILTFLTCAACILSTPASVLSARILAVSFISTVSHKITYEPLLEALASRGHNVTVLMPTISGKQVPNLTEILTFDIRELMASMPNWCEMRERGLATVADRMPFVFGFDAFSKSCSKTLELPHVLALLNQHYDAVIMSALFNECTAGFVHKLNTTLILVSPTFSPSWISGLFGSRTPPSFVPNLFTEFDERMDFWERMFNMWAELFVAAYRSWYFNPAMEHIYRQKLNDPLIPAADEIMRNASLIFSTSHFSLSRPRPLLPDIVEVAGMHCRPVKPLPKELDEFLTGSGPAGFIYFSMGSIQKGSAMSEKYRRMFLRTFAKLKQRVLWKWETEHMDEDLPPNVKLSKWLPQQDVLGHPNCKVFLTHGGFGGTVEAVYHGVPLVGIPMLGDQHLNMKKSVDAGFAISLEYMTLTEEELLEALTRVASDSRYRERVQAISAKFRDQPETPLQRAVFWTEYVIRHKGAPHLRSAARDLNWVQYHSVDVLVAILGILLFATVFLLYAVFGYIVPLFLMGLHAVFRIILPKDSKKMKTM